ncbi:undecaprenyldiphospho-muramoylpentapeptide beta-N-acetylglucosaminyltransferase [Marinomonas balearica]|uniref:UDP-N-acetylglucosamine--N-acetylmuramyl-(pentapeptide) pyrophosphoryl-undecaprenol N-acetylglucosamine transferase n=1 Tax=Marinomonas balearica TaxID=491947 RepID=A0A4R6MBQ3_9GAMM|nr:undecaprenyldiphospho-muramoylpentapeptide beta-N-acetylglucosaminyltransferase [Marinomonas balearica]TDO99048.1 UDP-N-acetylglucosamine-N-acetylmuramylpentapeptide N-acetylglucosamine transferase [Marinomonas balearica]
MSQERTVVIMAGGTGGHIYPALACANRFSQLGFKVVWLGSKGGMEESIVPAHNIPLEVISIKGVRGKGLLGLAKAPFQVLHAIGQAVAILRTLKPSVVLGMGGFVAGPGGVAAKMLGIPLVIHEQNAIAGTTNKLLSKVATLKLQAFDGALPAALTVGNPVRDDILSQDVRAARSNVSRPLKLLVVGGSLGARAINELIPEFLAEWQGSERLDVWHQTGRNNIDEVQLSYQNHGIESARVEPYIENMAQAYYWADIVVCRAGAMTVSELAVAGLPSILIPFPHAIDDHQTENAKHLSKLGGAFLLPQSDLNVPTVAKLLQSVVTDQDKLKEMGESAKRLALPDATQNVVSNCLRYAK